MRTKIALIALIGMNFGLKAQTNHLDGQTKLVNPIGRTLMIEKDNDDSWLTFHDPGQYIYSMGIDKSNSGSFSLNSGGVLNSSQFVMHSNGNVGIGTTNPNTKLDVNGSIKFDHLSSGHTNIQIGHDTNDRIFADNSANKYYGGGMFFRVTPDPSLNIAHNYIDVMTLSDKGTVGIGTRNTQGFKLGVNGKVVATEVKVATYSNWADFVFSKDYKLPTLKEVENHIKEKGHLKDIPSAEEVKKNGFFLGEMDAKLLQKIEELTLYTIEQQKEIENLKRENKQVNALKKMMFTLQNRLKKLESQTKENGL